MSFRNSLKIHNEKRKELIVNECLYMFICDMDTAKLYVQCFRLK